VVAEDDGKWSRATALLFHLFPVGDRHHHIVMPDTIDQRSLALSPLDDKPALQATTAVTAARLLGTPPKRIVVLAL
jgi:hypothetical protein